LSMVHLGTIEGYGQIIAGGDELGEVGYSISGFRPRQIKEFRGYLTGPNNVLMAVMKARGVILCLEDGQTVDIIVTRYSVLSDRAEFVVSGPVPGF